MMDARDLLSIIQLEQGVKTIEFECPKELVLLSRYGAWCDILDVYLDGGQIIELTARQERKLFKITDLGYQYYQATLPYLKMEWVINIKDLPIKHNDT